MVGCDSILSVLAILSLEPDSSQNLSLQPDINPVSRPFVTVVRFHRPAISTLLIQQSFALHSPLNVTEFDVLPILKIRGTEREQQTDPLS